MKRNRTILFVISIFTMGAILLSACGSASCDTNHDATYHSASNRCPPTATPSPSRP